jgi:acyl-CoA thioester hydrolase
MGIHLQRGQLAMSRLRHIEPVCRVEEHLIMNVEETYTWEGEVRDNETDLQGIVNNSNYFVYMAHTRHKHLKMLGIDFAEVAQRGYNLVLVHTDISFRDSLKSGDLFSVTSKIETKGKVRVVFLQKVIRRSDKKAVAEATNTTTCIQTQTGRPRFPEEIRKLFWG